MNTRKRILFGLAIITLLFLCSVAIGFWIYLKRYESLQKNEVERRNYHITTALKIQGKSFMKTAVDYAFWDEMVDFVQAPNAEWAFDNVNSSLYSLDIHHVIIYSAHWDKIYNTHNTKYEANFTPFDELNIHQIDENILNTPDKCIYFYVKDHNKIYEVAIAAIYRSSNLGRVGNPEGYFLIAKHLDNRFVSDIQVLTNSRITIIDKFNGQDVGQNHIVIPINSWNGKAVSFLDFYFDNKDLDLENWFSKISFLSNIVFLVIIILLLITFLQLFILKPLRVITDNIDNPQDEALSKLITGKDEFARLARLIKSYSLEKKVIETDYQKLIDNTNDLVCEISADGQIMNMSKAYQQLLFYRYNELVTKNFYHFIHPEEVDAIKQRIQSRTHSERIRYRFKSAKGEWHWLELTTLFNESTMNERGNSKLIIISLDINKQVVAQEQLQEHEQEYSSLMKVFPDLLFRLNSEGVIINYQTQDSSLLYLPPEQFIGKKFEEILPPFVVEPLKIKIEEAINSGVAVEFDYELPIQNNTKFYEARIIALHNSDIYLIIRDITERKMVERTMIENEQKLKEFNATKDKFFSVIAHDLRSPFSSIIIFIDMLFKDYEQLDREEVFRRIEMIHQTSHHTFKLLEDLLEWARIQMNKIPFVPEEFDLSIVLNETLELCSNIASSKHIAILSSFKSPQSIYGDKKMIQNIIRNLVTNSIKFTPRDGHITVTIIDEASQVVVSVSDDGVGMSAETIEKLFKIESTFSSPGTERELGSGLGLILCKEFVDKHNGRIWAESEEGSGSKFSFSIPKN